MDKTTNDLLVAYFSMEIMLETDIPTYAGGLGVLAGDLLRSCADLEVPAVGVSLVYSGNTFGQIINPDGSQSFKPSNWQKADLLTQLPQQIELEIQKTKVVVGCWRFDMVGQSEAVVPIFLLDTDLPENEQWARDITKNLYGGNGETRISQEIVLGIGGVKMLRALGYNNVKSYHMNEGHSAMVPLALLEENNFEDERVKKLCAFTTHTPVPEGHDKFDYNTAQKFAGIYLPWHIKNIATEQSLSMTHLAMNMSHVVFSVSKKHRQVSEHLFPGYKFDSITNGVHHPTWTNATIQNLFNKFIPGWNNNPKLLEDALEKIPDDAISEAHQLCKKNLIDYVNKHLTSVSTQFERENPQPEDQFDYDTLTIALARRPVSYKRPLLLYSDLERFIRIGVGKIQIIQCGKSHPNDNVSQGFVREIIKISKRLRTVLKICYLENYSPRIARLLVSGCDVWLNTPRRPLEASGTSGMKAALNGVINFSVLDGWWIEGFEKQPQAGFSIGPLDESVTPTNHHDAEDANDLYEKLENEIIPMYYDHHSEWLKRMKYAITLGAYFNTHRAIKEYVEKAWDVDVKLS
jgi:glycogen phosphorylase